MEAYQTRNASLIIREVRHRGMPRQAAVIAIITALVESELGNYASAEVPDSLKYPHDRIPWTSDGLGHDHASIGCFQQQTGYAWSRAGTSTMGSPDGWGTPAELMNVSIAAGKFLARLAGIDYQSWQPGAAAQHVQGSAFPGRYQERLGEAETIVDRLWASSTPPPKDWLSMATKAEVRTLIEDVVQAEIIKALQSYHLGAPRTKPYTHTAHPALFGANVNGGVDDRLKALEAKTNGAKK